MPVTIVYQVTNKKGVIQLVTSDKKAADQHDKMLSTAEQIAELVQKSGISMDEITLENLSIFLSKNNAALSAIFKGRPFADVAEQLAPADPSPTSPAA